MDMSRVRENYERMCEHLPFCTIKYAAKANNHPSVIEDMNEYVDGAICGSSHEAMVCLSSGMDPSELQVTAVTPKEESIDHCVDLSERDSGFTVTLNSMDTLRRLSQKGYQGRVVIRFMPDSSLRKDSKYREGSLAKFGMPPHEINEAVTYLRSNNSQIELIGFHNHLGGRFMNDTMGSYLDHVRNTLNRATNWLPLSEIEVINFGGGFGIPSEPEEEELDLVTLSEELQDILPLDTDTEFVLEPGRYIVGDAGQLLTRVKTIKETQYGRFVGVDAGMSEFPRPMIFDSYHNIRIVEDPLKHRPNVEQTVAGPTCSGADIFASDRKFGKAHKENLLSIEDVGAYGIVMASEFHSYPRPTLVTINS
jgi:diaminopimelate decarboxylase